MIYMFLKLGDVKGEVTEKEYAGWIEVLAWSNGMSFSEPYNRDETGRCNHQDLSLTKYLDTASTKIYQACSKGQKFASATLQILTENKDKYYTIRLKNVQISSCSMGGSGGENLLTENITLSFEKIEWTYYLPANLQKGKNKFCRESATNKKKWR
jgi:type VI secretion system secreted protein Hcp